MTDKIILHCGRNEEVLAKYPENYFDAIVCDPPYGIRMGRGKNWDYDVPAVETWQSILRVLKPGGHLLAFGGTRTYHRVVVNIEDAGFIIRDQIDWIYGSGFPHGQDISKGIDKKFGNERDVIGRKSGARYQYDFANNSSKFVNTRDSDKGDRRNDIGLDTKPASAESEKWDGWNTQLKPAHESICLAMKPISEKTIVENVLKWGTGGINIDACRIDLQGEIVPINVLEKWSGFGEEKCPDYEQTINTKGRYPANVIFDEEAGALLDAQSGVRKSGSMKKTHQVGKHGVDGNQVNYGVFGDYKARPFEKETEGSEGGASRFFYCPKSSRKERGEGNTHATVKPIALMEYLLKLVTPPNGVVLDPFMGSGSTLVAAKNLNIPCVGIDLDPEYVAIAQNRLSD